MVHSYNRMLLFSNKKTLRYTCKTAHSLQFHLYEVLEETNVIYDDRKLSGVMEINLTGWYYQAHICMKNHQTLHFIAYTLT